MTSQPKKNLKFILLLSAIVITITSLPYFYLYFKTPVGFVYNWSGAQNPVDQSVYYSYLEQVKQGHLLFQDLYTSEPHQSVLNLFWLVGGLIAKGLNSSPPLAFYFLRLLLIPFFIWTLKKTLDFFSPSRSSALLVLALFFTGWGLLLRPFLNHQPVLVGLDLAAVEATPFDAIFSSGHFILSWICLLWSVMFSIKTFQLSSYKYAFLTGLLNLFFLQFHPYYAPFVLLFSFVLGLKYVLKSDKFKKPWFFF